MDIRQVNLEECRKIPDTSAVVYKTSINDSCRNVLLFISYQSRKTKNFRMASPPENILDFHQKIRFIVPGNSFDTQMGNNYIFL